MHTGPEINDLSILPPLDFFFFLSEDEGLATTAAAAAGLAAAECPQSALPRQADRQ